MSGQMKYKLQGNAEVKKVKFVTLGCKVNQYETQAMRELLAREGIAEVPVGGAPCHFVVINTCTVTGETDRENRYWIRRMRRENPQAKVFVTGCYAQTNRKELESLPGVCGVVASDDQRYLARALLENGSSVPHSQAAVEDSCFLQVSSFYGKGRAFIKIQDGCDYACSFCKTVLARGRSRSRPLEAILDETVRLRDAGYREVVLTGIELGSYGRDLSPRLILSDVVEACTSVEGIERVRLSSLIPAAVTDELIHVLSNHSKCCPHLHLSVQSGDDGVLRLMGRPYCSAYILEKVVLLREAMSDFCLTLDVMTGFPGETEAAFERTKEFLRILKPLKCHVFPFSQREGTPAATFDALPRTLVVERARTLIDLAGEIGKQERQRFLGRIFPVLAEKTSGAGGSSQGLTPNYLRVRFYASGDVAGTMIPVRLESLQGEFFLGNPVTQPDQGG